MGESWTATYPRDEPPPKGVLAAHARELAAHLTAMVAHPKWTWTRLAAYKLGVHTHIMTRVHEARI